MKKNDMIGFRVIALALSVIALFSSVSCKKTPTLTSDGQGGYKDSKTEISYRGAPSAFEARGYIKNDVVALNDGIPFYALENAPSNEWLWSPDFQMLLYSRELVLPTISTFGTTGIRVLVEEDGTEKLAYDETLPGKIGEILSAFENGDEAPYDKGKTARYVFYLKLYSEEYSWLFYNLVYVQYAEDHVVYDVDEDGEIVGETNYGTDFLYDRSLGRFVAIGDELQKYIDAYYRNTNADGEV